MLAWPTGRLLFVTDIQQFEHGVCKEKATICGTLALVPIGLAFLQTSGFEQVSLRGARFGQNEEMVEFVLHFLSIAFLTLQQLSAYTSVSLSV